MRVEITYWELFFFITAIWILVRAIVGIKNQKVSLKRELVLLLVFTCIVVIARFIDFPLRHVDGKIAPMVFDSSKITPFWINLVPIVHLFDVYDGWQINIIGNITMFIPVGIVWPICFKELNTVSKTILAGLGFTFCIEISQLLLFDRCSDIDDIILNTVGTAIGALIYFGCRKIGGKKHHKIQNHK